MEQKAILPHRERTAPHDRQARVCCETVSTQVKW